MSAVTTRALRLAFAAILTSTTIARAQDSTFRWSFALGPTQSMRNWGRVLCGGTAAWHQCPSGMPMVTGAAEGQYHAALGISRRMPRTALVSRMEVLYSRAITRPSTAYPGSPILRALSDEMFLTTAGFDWLATPDRRYSPYINTTAGVGFNRLGWNADSLATEPNRHSTAFTGLLAFGIGFRTLIGKREYYVESRAFATAGAFSVISPLSFGIRF